MTQTLHRLLILDGPESLPLESDSEPVVPLQSDSESNVSSNVSSDESSSQSDSYSDSSSDSESESNSYSESSHPINFMGQLGPWSLAWNLIYESIIRLLDSRGGFS